MFAEGDAYDEVNRVSTPSDREVSRVRLVFELASNGLSRGRIASYLNEMSISYGRSRKWDGEPLANSGEQVVHGRIRTMLWKFIAHAGRAAGRWWFRTRHL